MAEEFKKAPGVVCGACAKEHGCAGTIAIYRDLFKRLKPHGTQCHKCGKEIRQGDEYAFAIF